MRPTPPPLPAAFQPVEPLTPDLPDLFFVNLRDQRQKSQQSQLSGATVTIAAAPLTYTVRWWAIASTDSAQAVADAGVSKSVTGALVGLHLASAPGATAEELARSVGLPEEVVKARVEEMSSAN